MSTSHGTHPPRPRGQVVFVGAGPGSADLITLRGAQRLAAADVVLHDALTDAALRDLAPNARWIDVGKRGYTSRSTGQATINALLVRHARAVGLVVRLKGGDPSVFGRLEEELEAMAQAGIACEVVPGVTAALAAAADSRRPLTRRGTGRSLSFATAMTHSGALAPGASPAPRADTETYYMAGKQLAALARHLVAAGWAAAAPARVSSWAGTPEARHSDHPVAALAQAAVLHAGRPCIVTVGAGARPLSGEVVPGGREAAQTQALKFEVALSAAPAAASGAPDSRHPPEVMP